MHLNGRLNAQVESDIVGYTTITMEAGKWYQVGSPFVALEDGITPMLNDIFTTGFGAGDTLSVYNPATSSYAMYYWNATRAKWTVGSRPSAADANVEIPSGQAVFINKATAGNVILSGKVSTNEVTEFGADVGNSWDQIVCVYPEAIKLNDLTWNGLSAGDTLSVYDPDTAIYATYYWNTTQAKWKVGSRPSAAEADVLLPVGQAVFVNKASVGVGSCSRNAE